jgi:DNA excision repair protein ERCC-1
MKNMYKLRIILVFCDIVSSLSRTCEDPADDQNEHQQSLREIMKIAIINEFTVFVAWS